MKIPRIKNSGYSLHGANRTKPAFMRWSAISKSPHEDISQNLELLRTRSRDLYAGGGPLGRGAIDRLTLNALGTGLKLNVRIDPEILGMSDEEASDWSRKTEAEFDYWASSKDCDISRMMNFYELQVLALRSVLLDGECLAMLPDKDIPGKEYSLRVSLLESDRLATPPLGVKGAMIDEGVELDSMGNPIAYWISNRNPDSELTHQPSLEYKRVRLFGYYSGRRNILHLYHSERIGQHRGIPYLSPVIELLKQLGQYTDAELMAAVVGGIFAVFFTHEQSPEGTLGEEDYASEEGLGDVPGYQGITQQQMYGSVMDLPEGVKPVSVSPGRPNTTFDAFVQSLVRQIGGTLGIPSELLFLHFTASYSASRGALLEAWKLFRYWRNWFAQNFCQPIYEEFLTEAVLRGRIKAPRYFDDDFIRKAYAWSEWTGPSQGQLNPVNEVQAAVLRLENKLSTYQAETGELNGTDFDLNVKQLMREQAMLKGLRANE